MTGSIEQRLAKLESADQIRALKVAYAAACDVGYDADALAELFVEDATWHTQRFGTFEGKDAIRAFFAEVSETITWAKHYMVGHVIEVHDDLETANGTCELLEPAVVDGQSILISGRYRDTYKKVGGRWLHATVDLQLHDIGGLTPLPIGDTQQGSGWSHSDVASGMAAHGLAQTSTTDVDEVLGRLDAWTVHAGFVRERVVGDPTGHPTPIGLPDMDPHVSESKENA